MVDITSIIMMMISIGISTSTIGTTRRFEHYEDIQEEQGWTDETLLGLLLDYLSDTDEEESIRGYLRYCAEEENAENKS